MSMATHGSLVPADETLNHQIIDTFGTVAQIRVDRGRWARALPWFPYRRSAPALMLGAMGWIWA